MSAITQFLYKIASTLLMGQKQRVIKIDRFGGTCIGKGFSTCSALKMKTSMKDLESKTATITHGREVSIPGMLESAGSRVPKSRPKSNSTKVPYNCPLAQN